MKKQQMNVPSSMFNSSRGFPHSSPHLIKLVGAPLTRITMTAAVRQKYRHMARLVQRLPHKQIDQSYMELRQSFRKPLQEGDSLDQRLKEADDRMSFLRMITPKERASGSAGTWVYKDGERLEHAGGTLRDSSGRVVSNWDGRNLDPDSVKRHNHQLKRAGFVNNAHAKGFF